jgi:hypothetical protein
VKVIHQYTGDVVNVGDEVVSFRGELATLLGISKIPGGASEGRVQVRWVDSEYELSYYPSVFALEIVGG